MHPYHIKVCSDRKLNSSAISRKIESLTSTPTHDRSKCKKSAHRAGGSELVQYTSTNFFLAQRHANAEPGPAPIRLASQKKAPVLNAGCKRNVSSVVDCRSLGSSTPIQTTGSSVAKRAEWVSQHVHADFVPSSVVTLALVTTSDAVLSSIVLRPRGVTWSWQPDCRSQDLVFVQPRMHVNGNSQPKRSVHSINGFRCPCIMAIPSALRPAGSFARMIVCAGSIGLSGLRCAASLAACSIASISSLQVA